MDNPSTGIWRNTSSLNVPRSSHTLTQLADGKVIVAGGFNFTQRILASAEIYDLANGLWTITGNLKRARYIPTANLLPDGQVFVAGGANGGYQPIASGEIYDPQPGVGPYSRGVSTLHGRVTLRRRF